ncbi:Vacuolar protease A [Kappamyces sp. JEL0829]|nr:Vacuolar protease A [Kappamyces sp. JEL0829]
MGNVNYLARVTVGGQSFLSSDNSCDGPKLPTENLKPLQKTFDLGYGTGHVSGDIFQASVSLGGTAVTIPIGSATQETDLAGQDGIMGLGFDALSAIAAQASTSTSFFGSLGLPKIFAVYLGNDGEANQGSITFGGIPEPGTLYAGPIRYLPLSDASHFWQIDASESTFSVGSVTGPLAAESLAAILDTGSSLIGLDPSVADALNTAIGASKDGGLYSIPCSKRASNPDVILNIQGASFAIPPSIYIMGGGDSCFSGFAGSAFQGKIVLGDTFLRAYFSVFDAEANRVGFAKAIHA